MLNPVVKILFFWIFISFCSPLWAVETDLILELKEAEEIATSDISLFKEKLKAIERKINQSQKIEQEYFRFLISLKDSLDGNNSKAITSLEEIINLSKYDFIITKSRNLLINNYAITRDWEKGLLLINNSNSLSENSSSFDDKTNIVFALFLNQVGDYELAKKYAQLIFNKKSTPKEACSAHTLVVEASLHLNKLNQEDAMSAFNQCKNIKQEIWAYFNLSYLAEHFLQVDEPKSSTDLLTKHVLTIEKLNYKALTLLTYSLLSEGFYTQNQLLTAESFALKTIAISDDAANLKPIANSHKILHEIYLKKGNKDLALKHLSKYIELDHQVLDQNKAKTIAIQLAKTKINDTIRDNEILNQKNQALLLEQDLAKEEAKTLTLIILILVLIASFAAIISIRTKRTHIKLKQFAEFDSLTGIANRRYFSDQSEDQLKRLRSKKHLVSFIHFDLDKFKAINDTYGHAIGDWVLRVAPNCVKKVIRKVDLFGRVGGEEFAILLPDCDLETAQEIAETIRAELVKINSEESGHKFDISASFGVTNSLMSGYDLDALMRDSDQAMYKAKLNGRNCVHVYEGKP